MAEHLDDQGQPCTRHTGIPEARLFELATLGSRVSGFHHDAASKLQSLVMALDEIGETAEVSAPDMMTSVETARTAMKDLNALFNANRALAKGPQRTRVVYRDVLARAAERVGVKLTGAVPSCEVRVTVPALTHALAVLLDVAAGGSRAKRVVDIGSEVAGGCVVLTIHASADAIATPPPNASEAVAIAAFVIARDEGELRCGAAGDKFLVELPVAVATTK
jgi:hypothetical protein